ncbi:MAG: TonB-dependent receptor [Acidobacteria bacterium]|nr:TonB-dependent receptor [Acidobacteriota bacterium]MCW5949991.1 TonB-dependent receptor [Pyrinomonadaceae bacterium]
MKRKIYVLPAILGLGLILSASVLAQSGSVSGTVTESSRGLALSGASVRVEGSPNVAVTDGSGRFVLLGVAAGKAKLTVSYLGFEDVTEEVTVTAGQTTTWDPSMSVAAQSYSVTVTSDADLTGQARALNDQKNSINQVNLVAADQIGSFPDPNAAEAIQRVPGITVQRDQGEGRYVLIRGTEPRLSATTINGDRIGTTENTSRQIPLDTIPADLMGALEVTKAFTPDVEGDSIGGRVNLITKRAPAKRQFALTIASGFNTLVRDDVKNYTGTYGQRFFAGRLGFIGSVNFYRTDRGSQDLEPAYTSTFGLNSVDLRDYSLTRTRYGGTWDIDYRFDARSEIYSRGLVTEYEDRERRFRMRDLISNSRLERTLRQRYHDSAQAAYSLGGRHILPNNWTLSWRGSFSDAELRTPYRLESTFRQNSVTFSPNVTPSSIDRNNIQANPLNQNPNLFNFNQNAIQNDKGYERNVAGNVDVAAPIRIGNGAWGLFKFGVKWRDANRTRDVETFTQTLRTGTLRLVDVAFTGYNPPDGFLNGKYPEFLNLFPDPKLMMQFSREGTLFNTVRGATGDSGSYRAKERVTAGYAMQEFYLGEKTTILGGVRFEYTDTKYGAPQYRLGTGGAVLSRAFVTGGDKYLSILPSIHFRRQLFQDTPFRISYSRSLARPNYNSLAPFQLQDTSALTINRGNPELKVTNADNFDVSVERYFKSVGVMSAGFFYKRLTNYIYTATEQQTIGTDLYRITQPINGAAANLYGAEFSLVRRLDFLPGVLKDIDVYANYTWTRSNATLPRGKFQLPSQASNMGNVAVGYTRSGFSGRVSMNYQGKLPLAIGATENDDNWLDKRIQLDFSASQRITRNVKVFIDVLNLANQPYRVYQSRNSNYAIQQEIYKIWGLVGVKLSF